MLLEQRRSFKRSMLPKCTSPKPMRSFSPAISEISVGSPSPPPTPATFRVMPLSALRNPPGAFQPPVQVKRLRLLQNAESSDSESSSIKTLESQRKSNADRVKSFSIADILGKKDASNEDEPKEQNHSQAPPPAIEPTTPTNPLLNERLQTLPLHATLPTLLPHGLPPMLLELSATTPTKSILSPWDPTGIRGPLPVRSFFSPAHLLHYEQRLAWDYQRQLQEHFQLQAQMMRQMSMDPNVIQSEDGSERDSRSRNSTGSACCSPEVNVNSNDSLSESAEKSTKDASTTKSTNCTKERRETNDENSADDKIKKSTPGDTPLDALFQLSTKNFDEEQDPSTLSIFATRPNPKKKRKSRTAFTNHQIFELEKRFLYQKYLSPADRDEIAAGLGLSNAQVITWFQNRRAKLKRDMEELKKDVESVKQLPDLSADIRHQLQLQQQRHHKQHQDQQFSITTHNQNVQQSWQHPQIPTHMQHLLPLTTTTACGKPQINSREYSSIIIEDRRDKHDKQDKQQLKLLKMMTLLHYGASQ